MVLCFVFVQSTASRTFSQNNESGLILKLDSPKNIYKLGETIDFSFELENKTNEAVTLLDLFGTGTGFLHVEASKNGNEFIGCDDPRWGIMDVGAKTYINPNESVKSKSDVLWTLKTQDIAGFRFDEAGVYYIKANYTAHIEGKNSPINTESLPIQITIEEPVGDDLKVWNIIKENGEFAYFIQKGHIHIPSYKAEERARFLREVEQILNDYPNTFYADSLRQSMDKFKASEIRSQEMMKKLKKQSQKQSND
ncbi:MAG: hypothetical protein ACR2F2_01790 [Pyrinomonadaceae bacterium]